jgi:histidinol dehydrogenase
MKVIRYTDTGYEKQLRRLNAPSSLFDPEIEKRVAAIIGAVRHRGDDALVEFSRRFDGVRLHARQFAITAEELLSASSSVTSDLRRAIAVSRRNLERFSRHSLRRNWTSRNEQGGRVGEKYDPYQRVGLYVPGGTAPLVSTALMTITLARAAGCPEIVVCSPCDKEGQLNPAMLYAMRCAGATEIYRLGGAQAVAAMALGTATIPRVQKVFGPGNAYVVAAKRLLFGYVAVDLLPGPSEVLILADDTAKADWVAADLLAQAEHGSGHERTWLVTSSKRLLGQVQAALEKQAARLARREFILKSLHQNGWLILVRNLEAAIGLTNQLAPEHCEIMTRQAAQVSRRIFTAGAICIGDFSPNVLGDYVAGPSHVLPTGGAGRAFAGLTADQFQHRTSVIQYDRVAVRKSLPAIAALAKTEGLDAHLNSAAIRLEAYT